MTMWDQHPSGRPAVLYDEQALESLLPGFSQDSGNGRVFVVDRRFDLDYAHGAYQLRRVLDIPSELLARAARTSAFALAESTRVAYLDIETTGLSGGSETAPFLVGIGHFVDGSFRLRQYLLTSLNAELALLGTVAAYFDRFDAVVTFNGTSFDLPVLDTRLLLAGLPSSLRSLTHFDLLPASRRIYRDRFSSCRLGEIERQALGFERVEDVASAIIPSLFVRYVEQRRFRALLPIVRHNALDVLSLVTLAAHIGELYQGGPALGSDNQLAMARICAADGYVDEAVQYYRATLSADLPHPVRDRAEQELALAYKRAGRVDEAVSIWQAMAARPENRSIGPLVHLARYYERQERDAATAASQLEQALRLLRSHHLRLGARGAEQQAARLEAALARLQARQNREKGSAAPRSKHIIGDVNS